MSLESAANNPEIQKLLPKVYDDLLSKSFKKVGDALGDTIEFTLSFSKLAKYGTSRIDLVLSNNLRKYKEKLESIPEEKIASVPPEISAPILQKLTYTTNEEIADLFTNILQQASSVDTAKYAHPAFADMVSRISTDEAKIVKYLIDKKRILYVNIRAYTSSSRKGFIDPAKYLTALNTLPLDYRENIPTYLANFVAMGVLVDRSPEMIQVSGAYDAIKQIHRNDFEATKAFHLKAHPEYVFDWQPSLFDITPFGIMFLKAIGGKQD